MDATAWFLIIIVAVVLAFVGYGMARRARGSIELTLPKSAFEPGETIQGTFVLHAKKPIEAERLVVTLTATEVTETTEDGKTNSRSRQAFRDERVLEEARAYAADTRETREFQIDVPNPEVPDEPTSAVGRAALTALKVVSRSKTHLRWRLEVRLVAKGIDLVTSKPRSVTIQRL